MTGWGPRAGIVTFVLMMAIAANVIINVLFPDFSNSFPFIGAAVACALLLTAPVRRPDWEIMPEAIKGSILSIIASAVRHADAVERLPSASWQTALVLGFVSAVFDNIPLTALALQQGGYDWGALAYAVGFGGSMIWFDSSAGGCTLELVSRSKIGRSLVEVRLARDGCDVKS